MRKSVLRGGAVAAAGVLVLAGTALALRLQAGNIVVVTDGGVRPTKLPKNRFAPIELHGYGKISTLDGAVPPVLEQITLFFDKHGEVETRGLPVCTPGKLAATTSKTARRNCRGAIVGRGFGRALIDFPDQPPFMASSPITIFNGRKKNGNPTVLAHAYLGVPAPTTFIVPIEVQRVRKGRYGFKTVAKIPRIAGGSGVPIYGRLKIGRKWRYKGKKLSYANASCPDGRLQARGRFDFDDGNRLQGTFLQRCQVRR